jgi:hypothetical protein
MSDQCAPVRKPMRDWRTCNAHQKVLFESRQEALAAIDRMLAQRVSEARWLNAYECDNSSRGWHVGRVHLP